MVGFGSKRRTRQRRAGSKPLPISAQQPLCEGSSRSRDPAVEPLLRCSGITTEELLRFQFHQGDDLCPTKEDTTVRSEQGWVGSVSTGEDSTTPAPSWVVPISTGEDSAATVEPLQEGSAITTEDSSVPAPSWVDPITTGEDSAATVEPLQEGSAITTEEDSSVPEQVWVGSLSTGEDSTAPAPSWVGSITTEDSAATTKKYSRPQKLKWHNILIEKYIKTSLKKYNGEQNFDEDLCFKFVKCLKQSLIIEGMEWYRHFNFEAQQSDNSVVLFFAEVVIDSSDCEVTCCMPLRDNKNGRCLGCRNQGDPDLRHPTNDTLYVGGHIDCLSPFLIDSDSEGEGEGEGDE